MESGSLVSHAASGVSIQGPNTDILSQQALLFNNTYGAKTAARLFFGKGLVSCVGEAASWPGFRKLRHLMILMPF